MLWIIEDIRSSKKKNIINTPFRINCTQTIRKVWRQIMLKIWSKVLKNYYWLGILILILYSQTYYAKSGEDKITTAIVIEKLMQQLVLSLPTYRYSTILNYKRIPASAFLHLPKRLANQPIKLCLYATQEILLPNNHKACTTQRAPWTVN